MRPFIGNGAADVAVLGAGVDGGRLALRGVVVRVEPDLLDAHARVKAEIEANMATAADGARGDLAVTFVLECRPVLRELM